MVWCEIRIESENSNTVPKTIIMSIRFHIFKDLTTDIQIIDPPVGGQWSQRSTLMVNGLIDPP